MARISKEISTFTEKEVSLLFKKAKVLLKHTCFYILCAPATKNFGRMLVVTPKRIGKANKRNLVRRRIKEIFYQEGLFKNQLDCIVIVKREGINLPFAKLKKLIANAYSKNK